MSRTLAAAALALVLASAGALADDCQLKQFASLDMQLTTPTNRILVPASIDDTPRLVMIDTGAPIGMLEGAVTDELGIAQQSIARTRMAFFGATGRKAESYVVVPSFKIGPNEARNTDFLVHHFLDSMPAGFAGTVGTDILKNFDVDFDFAAKKVNLFSQDHCPGKVVYWAKSYTDADARIDREGKINVTMTLDGHDVDALIDTGAPFTLLFAGDAKALFGIDASSPGAEPIAGDPGTFRYQFKSLALSGVTMPNPTIIVLPDAMTDAERRDLVRQKMQGYQGNDAVPLAQMVLGADALRHLHVYVAYAEKKIYVTSAGAH